jgi:hypothetical protein
MAAADLLLAYVRRKRFEAKLIAIEFAQLFTVDDVKRMQRVPADELLKMMGVE